MPIPIRPMLASLGSDLPTGSEWIYEIKYDGYRCIAQWTESGVDLYSRNGHSLNLSFPEVVNDLILMTEEIKSLLPLIFDGELCILETPYKASFEALQKRGRLKDVNKIKRAAADHTATYLVFDVLSVRGERVTETPLLQRKEKLQEIFKKMSAREEMKTKPIEFFSNGDELWSLNKKEKSEGIIAKRCKSNYVPGARSEQWIKIKNPQTGIFFITAYEKKNGYFHVAARKDGETVSVGLFSHGLSSEERRVLIEVIKSNKSGEDSNFIKVLPSICVELQYLEIYKDQLRHPRFVAFRLDVSWEDCTWEKAISSRS
ncbi:non-homologous end-joining DNA ligase [Fictibacillus sp. FJAT-27399]|uniref:non-homologous end-joining DNA ligase n=1 Tax=Fictibacillus sp. FJAT-27399 TaxID=1729689 RepID=UPI000AC19C09|nr:non-homologous end-joining DNA ligase [Fictibacillus sp. FJAT-27399]